MTDSFHRSNPHLRRSRPLRSPASREKASMRLDCARSSLGVHITSPISTTLSFAALLNLCMLARRGHRRTLAITNGALGKRRSIVRDPVGSNSAQIPDPRSCLQCVAVSAQTARREQEGVVLGRTYESILCSRRTYVRSDPKQNNRPTPDRNRSPRGYLRATSR